MFRAATAVGLEPQHDLIVARVVWAWLRRRHGLLRPALPCRLDTSLVSYRHGVGYRRSPGDSALHRL
jgi:hypothetical protein